MVKQEYERGTPRRSDEVPQNTDPSRRAAERTGDSPVSEGHTDPRKTPPSKHCDPIESVPKVH